MFDPIKLLRKPDPETRRVTPGTLRQLGDAVIGFIEQSPMHGPDLDQDGYMSPLRSVLMEHPRFIPANENTQVGSGLFATQPGESTYYLSSDDPAEGQQFVSAGQFYVYRARNELASPIVTINYDHRRITEDGANIGERHTIVGFVDDRRKTHVDIMNLDQVQGTMPQPETGMTNCPGLRREILTEAAARNIIADMAAGELQCWAKDFDRL